MHCKNSAGFLMGEESAFCGIIGQNPKSMIKINILKKIKEKKGLLLTALIVICVVSLGYYHDRRTCWGSNDFDTYYFAGKLVLLKTNLYTHEAFKTTLSPFLYLPFFATLIAPAALLNIRIAAAIWYMFNVLALAGAFYLAVRLVAGGEKPGPVFFKRPYLLRIISGVVLIGAWLDNVSLAQVDFMIFFLILLSLFAHEKKKRFISGIILAAASVIKIYPCLFLLYFLAKRRFKAAAGFFVGILLFLFVIPWTVMGGANFSDSMKSWMEIRAAPHLSGGGDSAKVNYARFESQFKPSNQSFSAAMVRYLTRDEDDGVILFWKTQDFKYDIPLPHPLTPRQVDILIKVLLLLIFSATFSVLDYRLIYGDRLYLSLEYSLIFLCMILFFPVAQTHMLASIIFPVIVFNYAKTKSGARFMYGSRWMEIVFLGAVILYFAQADRYMKILGAGAFSILLLWILFISMLIKERAERGKKSRNFPFA